VGELAAFDGADALPDDARALLDAASAEDFQFGAGWFRALATSLPEGARPRFLLYREAGAVALLPLQIGAGRPCGLATLYTTRFRPPVAAGASDAALLRAGAAFGAACRAAGTLRLDALDADWPPLAPLLAGFRQGGMVALRFAHFGNWRTGLADWAGYCARRPPELRTTIRRRLARAARDASLVFTLTDGRDPDALAEALAAYEAVYAASWKPPEPYPAFTAALFAEAGESLRLAVLRQGGVPVAAQYWLLAGGTATVLKLAHDEAARALSPGTLLTALTIRHLIEHDRITALDFGRGDDAYKEGWTGERRQRIGVLLCSPRHPAGLAELARHAVRSVYKNLMRRRKRQTA
jgi:hypothetical protein